MLSIVGGIPLDAPNAYSDDDQSIYQKAINNLPYYGMQYVLVVHFKFNQLNQFQEKNLHA